MRALRRALASPSFVAGSVMLAIIVLAAVFAPALAPHSPTAQDLGSGLLPPSAQHLFGTDQLGRDVFSRVLFAARTDLGIAFAAAISPFVIGVALGLISGYFGRSTDWIISRVTDTVIAFPFYVLIIAIVFAIGAGAQGIIITFALVGWVGHARVIRALTASMREQGWVRAARGGGLSNARILVRHILPNVMPQAVVLLATEIVLIMIAIVTLGYLGLGVRPPTPDWGTMIADGQSFVTSHWWLSALPGLAVVIVGVALSLLGDGVGDALRVVGGGSRRLRQRRRSTPRRVSPTQGVPSSISSPSSTSSPDLLAQPPAGTLQVHSLTIEGSQNALSPRSKQHSATPRPLVGGGGGAGGLSLEVGPGEALGIVGESGSGKSLTLRAIAGLLPSGVRQTSGEIAVGGSLGMVFQDPLTALDPLTRVGTQLREACRAAGAANPAGRVFELLADVRLPEAERIARSYPHELSGGQRQRIVIAMALAGSPAVLLADEPTTALDVTVQREVLELLEELRRERGLTLVLVSHDLAVVSSVCERIVVMRHGEIVERGETAVVLSAPEHPYTRQLIAAVPELPALGSVPTSGSTPKSGSRTPTVAPKAPLTTPERGVRVHAHEPTSTPSAAQTPPPALAMRGVGIHYGHREAVTDITFEVRGSLGIVGESGSGKTTVARAIAGELPISAGEIVFDGERLPGVRRSRASRAAIQLIPQDPTSSLNPRLTAGQTLTEVLRVHGLHPRGSERERVAHLLAQVGLEPSTADSYPHELSGGQRQRVAIARALAVSPRLLIADEATSALDVSVQAEIIALLRRLREDLGLALIVISHDLAVVHALCDEIVVMRAGRVVEQGENVLVDPQQPYTRELLTAVPRLA